MKSVGRSLPGGTSSPYISQSQRAGSFQHVQRCHFYSFVCLFVSRLNFPVSIYSHVGTETASWVLAGSVGGALPKETTRCRLYGSNPGPGYRFGVRCSTNTPLRTRHFDFVFCCELTNGCKVMNIYYFRIVNSLV